MARYIDADELANKLNDLLKDIDREIDKARGKSKIYSKKFIEGSALQQMGIACALQEVLDAPTADVVERKKGEWIPCSERFPKENGRYLCSNDTCGAFEVDWNAWIYGQWLYANENPIAWMPLPEPYTESEVDE